MATQPENTPVERLTGDQKISTRPVGPSGYTGRWQSTLVAFFGFLAFRDLGQQGAGYILTCFGVSSRFWAWFWLIASLLLTWCVAYGVSLWWYLGLAVGMHQDSDPLNPMDAGVFDIPNWSSLLSYLAVLFLFGLIPGRFGVLRPTIIIGLSAIFACTGSLILTHKVVRAIYGPSVVRKSISRKQCEMRSVRGAQCSNWVFRSRFLGRLATDAPKEFCRAHYIELTTRQRYASAPRRVVVKQYLALFMFVLGWLGVWNFVISHSAAWMLLSAFAFGTAIKNLSESIIGPWYALSRIPAWARLLAAGFVVQIVAGIGLLALGGLRPQAIYPLVNYLGKAPMWLSFGPPIVCGLVTLFVSIAFNQYWRRLWFYTSFSLASLFFLTTFLPLWNMLSSAFSQYRPFSDWSGNEFWQVVMSGEVKRDFWLVFFTGLVPAMFVVKSRDRSRRATGKVSSWPRDVFGPVVVTLLAMLGGRYLLHGVGANSTALFAATTFALSTILSLILRRLPKTNS